MSDSGKDKGDSARFVHSHYPESGHKPDDASYFCIWTSVTPLALLDLTLSCVFPFPWNSVVEGSLRCLSVIAKEAFVKKKIGIYTVSSIT